MYPLTKQTSQFQKKPSPLSETWNKHKLSVTVTNQTRIRDGTANQHCKFIIIIITNQNYSLFLSMHREIRERWCYQWLVPGDCRLTAAQAAVCGQLERSLWAVPAVPCKLVFALLYATLSPCCHTAGVDQVRLGRQRGGGKCGNQRITHRLAAMTQM